MLLHSPIVITARLLPGVKIGDAWISIEPTDREHAERIVWTMYIDFADGTEFSCNDLSTFRHDTQNALASCLSFLAACGEGYGYQLRTGRESDNADMFPANVAEWAYQNSDELSMLQAELEDDGRVLIEENGMTYDECTHCKGKFDSGHLSTVYDIDTETEDDAKPYCKACVDELFID